MNLRKINLSIILVMIVFFAVSCAGNRVKTVKKIGYAVQVGAFSELDNAVSFAQELQKKNVESYYYKDSYGVYKVRFGDFATYEEAVTIAEEFKTEKVIDSYFVVLPETYVINTFDLKKETLVREQIVDTARQYLGAPYIRGGMSDKGFDCSGFALVVYKLNGIDLPRTSASQFKAGDNIHREELRKGDLVFFKINKRYISHVGVYIGDNKFIHAPSINGKIRVDDLNDTYFAKRYAGAKTFLSDNIINAGNSRYTSAKLN